MCFNLRCVQGNHLLWSCIFLEVGGYFHIYFHLCFFNVAFISFSFLCCEFPVTLSYLCLGWWPKEPAGLKTLRLVSMPSWRHTNSEEQEEEDDDDVVGPPGDASISSGTAGPSESLRSPVAQLPIAFFPIHLGIWVPKKAVKTNCASYHCYMILKWGLFCLSENGWHKKNNGVWRCRVSL